MLFWNDLYLALFDRCVTQFESGDADYTQYFSEMDLRFLASIGYQPREFFDFIEDFCNDSLPTKSTSLLIAAVRRDYFLTVQKGGASQLRITRDDLPTFGEELDGMTYLPRILKKARAKLRGELDPDLMYACGGDRKFLHEHGGIHPADFLRHVWACADDDAKLAKWVRTQATANSSN